MIAGWRVCVCGDVLFVHGFVSLVLLYICDICNFIDAICYNIKCKNKLNYNLAVSATMEMYTKNHHILFKRPASSPLNISFVDLLYYVLSMYLNNYFYLLKLILLFECVLLVFVWTGLETNCIYNFAVVT